MSRVIWLFDFRRIPKVPYPNVARWETEGGTPSGQPARCRRYVAFPQNCLRYD